MFTIVAGTSMRIKREKYRYQTCQLANQHSTKKQITSSLLEPVDILDEGKNGGANITRNPTKAERSQP